MRRDVIIVGAGHETALPGGAIALIVDPVAPADARIPLMSRLSSTNDEIAATTAAITSPRSIIDG